MISWYDIQMKFGKDVDSWGDFHMNMEIYNNVDILKRVSSKSLTSEFACEAELT